MPPAAKAEPPGGRCASIETDFSQLRESDARACLRELVAALPHLAPPLPLALVRNLIKVLAGPEPTLRAAAIRLLRHAVARDIALWREAARLRADHFIARSLERDVSSLEERVEALRLFRHLAEDAPALLSAAQLASVSAVADCAEDALRGVCLESLRRLAVLETTGGLCRAQIVTPLFNAIVPAQESVEPVSRRVALPLLFTIAYLLDRRSTRRRLCVPRDVRLLLSPLSELEASTAERSASIGMGQTALVALGTTWAGLIVMAADPLCLRALLGVVRHGAPRARARRQLEWRG